MHYYRWGKQLKDKHAILQYPFRLLTCKCCDASGYFGQGKSPLKPMRGDTEGERFKSVIFFSACISILFPKLQSLQNVVFIRILHLKENFDAQSFLSFLSQMKFTAPQCKTSLGVNPFGDMIAVFKLYHNGAPSADVQHKRHSSFLWPLEKVWAKKILGTVPQTLTEAKRA